MSGDSWKTGKGNVSTGIAYTAPYGLLNVAAGGKLSVCLGSSIALTGGWVITNNVLGYEELITGEQVAIRIGKTYGVKGSEFFSKKVENNYKKLNESLSKCVINLTKSKESAVDKINSIAENESEATKSLKHVVDEEKENSGEVIIVIDKNEALEKKREENAESQENATEKETVVAKKIEEKMGDEIVLVEEEDTLAENQTIEAKEETSVVNEKSSAITKKKRIADVITLLFGEYCQV